MGGSPACCFFVVNLLLLPGFSNSSVIMSRVRLFFFLPLKRVKERTKQHRFGKANSENCHQKVKRLWVWTSTKSPSLIHLFIREYHAISNAFLFVAACVFVHSVSCI